jgi:hypothetical protein
MVYNGIPDSVRNLVWEKLLDLKNFKVKNQLDYHVNFI